MPSFHVPSGNSAPAIRELRGAVQLRPEPAAILGLHGARIGYIDAGISRSGPCRIDKYVIGRIGGDRRSIHGEAAGLVLRERPPDKEHLGQVAAVDASRVRRTMRIWTEEPERFKLDPYRHSAGLHLGRDCPLECGRRPIPRQMNSITVSPLSEGTSQVMISDEAGNA